MSVIIIKAVSAVVLFYTALQANIPEVKLPQENLLPTIENPLQQDIQMELLEEKLNLIRLLQKFA